MARKIKKETKSRKNEFKPLLLILGFVLIITGLIGVYRVVKEQLHSVVETPQSEVKRVPHDVRKNLKKDFAPTYRVPILLYHYVEYVSDKKDTTRQSLDISPYVFEQQVKTLHDAGYTFMTASQLADAINKKRELPGKPVLLTFDDGHWDVDTVILPILKKYHAKATAYLISGFLNGSDFLTDAEVKDLINSHLIEIGAHTVHHISLKGVLQPVVVYEVNQSKQALEKNYYIKVVSFAYPDGAFDQQAIDDVKAAGYTSAVSTIPWTTQSAQNRFFLFRLRPGYRTGQELINYLNQNSFKSH